MVYIFRKCIPCGIICWTMVLMAILLNGCTPRSYMVGTMADIFEDGLVHFEKDTDREMLRQSLPATIKMVETFGAAEPANADLNLILARLYAAYGLGFISPDYLAADLNARIENRPPPDDLRLRLSGYYLKGMQAAARALSPRYPQFENRVAEPEAMRRMSRKWRPKDVPGLFWYGFCLGRYIDLNRDDLKAFSKAYLVELVMQFVAAEWPEYFHGGAHSVLMSYYASRSPMLGGNPQKARFHYEQAKTIAPELWLTDYFWGRYHLIRTQEQAAFEALMGRISKVRADDSRHPFYNQLAALLAQLHLAHADHFF